jgi:hypothetical protein
VPVMVLHMRSDAETKAERRKTWRIGCMSANAMVMEMMTLVAGSCDVTRDMI